jgi:hypothetical protein
VRSRSVIMVYGEALFHLWELEATMDDVCGRYEPKEYSQQYSQRNKELGLWGRLSVNLNMIFSRIESPIDVSIWDLVRMFDSNHCSDPRDRVFALLALADSESREAFSPDYTTSATAVFLQLIEHHVKSDKESWRSAVNFDEAHKIICAFRFGPDNPDIAAMRDRRQTVVHGEGPSSDSHIPSTESKTGTRAIRARAGFTCRAFRFWLRLLDIVATRNQRPLSIQEHIICSSDRLTQRMIFDKGSNHVVVDAGLHCTVWKNDAGELVAPLQRRQSRARRLTGHDFSTGQGSTTDGRRLHTPDESVIGLANKQIQHGDIILLFDGGAVGIEMFRPALVVRRHTSVTATIVGQCIFDSDVRTCRGGSICVCGGVTHVWENGIWKVLMSPEDLLVFVAQDLKFVHRQSSRVEAPAVKISVHLEKSRERLTTSVTSEEFSSYAIFDAGFDQRTCI